MNVKKNGDIKSADLILIDRILNDGETEVFADLINKYKSAMFNLALRMTKNYSEAEDVTQEIFVKVYAKLADYKVRYKFRDWLYAIATNAINDRLRKRKFSFFSIDKPVQTEEKEIAVDFIDNKTVNPEDELIQQEEKQKITKVMVDLPVKYRNVIVLRYLEKMSYEEIASVTRLSIGTVKTRLHRGQRILYKKLNAQK
jgi:RNA polymerase sigma-70 factor (ECF subfamily)